MFEGNHYHKPAVFCAQRRRRAAHDRDIFQKIIILPDFSVADDPS
jgi:hypothetical protein